jgi:hypothetical protein
MKTALDHLPEDKRAQITAAAALLTESARPCRGKLRGGCSNG